MKIIHCADLHIDSKNLNRFSAEKRRMKKNQMLKNFADMVDFAEENKVAAILLCGDVFDSNLVVKRTLKVVQDIILAHQNITFFYICGNHDEKVSVFEKNPVNFVVFKEKFSKVDFGDVCIGGIGYKRNIDADFYDQIDFQKQDFNILMMHCPVINNDPYSEAVQIKRLDNKFVDYLALGHIHKKNEGKIGNRGQWVFSGCLESDSFSYCGNDFGFYMLEIKDNNLRKEFVEFSKNNYQIVEIDLSNTKTHYDFVSQLDEKLKNFGNQDIVKVIFSGVRKEDDDLNLNFVLDKYNNSFFYLESEDRSKIEFNLEKYAKEKLSLKAEFIKEVFDDESLSDEDKQKICIAGLEALKGEDISL